MLYNTNYDKNIGLRVFERKLLKWKNVYPASHVKARLYSIIIRIFKKLSFTPFADNKCSKVFFGAVCIVSVFTWTYLIKNR